MKFWNKIALFSGSMLAAVSAFADAATGPDYSSITSAVNATTIVAGIAAIAGVKVLPIVARWGFDQVMAMMARGR